MISQSDNHCSYGSLYKCSMFQYRQSHRPIHLVLSSISDTHQNKMNVSICKTYTDGHESEPTREHERDQKPYNACTNEAGPLTTKKMKCSHMNILSHGMIALSDFILLDSYQNWLDLDSNLTMTGKIYGIPRKNSSWWTTSWENNFLMTKIQNKSLYNTEDPIQDTGLWYNWYT